MTFKLDETALNAKRRIHPKYHPNGEAVVRQPQLLL